MKPPEFVWTIATLLHWSSRYFARHAIDSPRTTAELLLAHTLQVSRLELYLRFDQPLLESELATYKQLILRRIKHEPTAYIVGVKAFWSLELEVNPSVLIPRPDTECLVESALALLPSAQTAPSWRVLDLGTGSGAIILALAATRPGHRYMASDVSRAALRTARRNARRHNLHEAVSFFVGDWLAPLQMIAAFDLIVSNPPYVTRRDLASLPPEIIAFEPLAALDGANDGLAAIRLLIEQAPACLNPGGHLLLEIGYDQKEAAAQMARDHQTCRDITFRQDYAGKDRVMALTFV